MRTKGAKDKQPRTYYGRSGKQPRGMAENTRLRIKTTKLVELLHRAADGEVELSTTRLRAIELLLRKTLPDLQSIEVNTNTDNTPRVINAEPMDADEWEARYSSSLEPAGGTTKGTH